MKPNLLYLLLSLFASPLLSQNITFGITGSLNMSPIFEPGPSEPFTYSGFFNNINTGGGVFVNYEISDKFFASLDAQYIASGSRNRGAIILESRPYAPAGSYINGKDMLRTVQVNISGGHRISKNVSLGLGLTLIKPISSLTVGYSPTSPIEEGRRVVFYTLTYPTSPIILQGSIEPSYTFWRGTKPFASLGLRLQSGPWTRGQNPNFIMLNARLFIPTGK